MAAPVFLGMSRFVLNGLVRPTTTTSWRMFLFERFQLFGIIGTAIVVAGPGLWLIQRRGRTVRGTAVSCRAQAPQSRNDRGQPSSDRVVHCLSVRDLFWSTSGKRCKVSGGPGGRSRGAGAFGTLHTRLQVLFGLSVYHMLPTAKTPVARI